MKPVAPRSPLPEGLSSCRVLIVDDDRDFADSLADVLESHGYVVSTAYDGASALQLTESFDPHVALIDLRLGVERGTDLIDGMRARRPAMICIMMTAYAALDSAVQALRNRADDYLLKPLDPQGVLSVINQTVTRVRELELAERRERLASLGSLAAGVAHDLNNVLTIVLNETELIERQLPDREDTVRTALQSIRASTQRAAQITHNLLLIARGDPTATPCSAPREVLEELAATVSRSLPPGATLQTDLHSEADLQLAIGASQLYQVVLNLLVNARDAIGDHGQVRLRSRVSPPPAARSTPARRTSSPPQQEGLLISVADNGAGMDAPTLQRIFEPFFTTKARGTGLGLATAYGLVRASEGEMFVESTQGAGSEFSVWIPLASGSRSLRPSGIVLSEPPAGASSAAPSGEHLSVLLCDDDGMILQALSRMLRDLGHDVTLARNLDDAWSSWQRAAEPFSVVITDVRLGADRGTELARKVLADRPDTLVVLMSGDFQSIDIRNPVWTRVAHLQKPFDRSALRAALSSRRRRRTEP